MKTVNDVLCFLNELDFVDKLDNDYCEKLVEVKKIMVREFEDYNMSKTFYLLNIADDIKLSSITNNLDEQLEGTDSLRSVIFYLISFKHLVDTNNKQVDE